MSRSHTSTRAVGALLSGLVIAIAVVSMGPAASAALADPVWRIDSLSNTTVAPGSVLDYLVEARNVGDASTDGSPITITATLPDGMTAESGIVRAELGSNVACTAPVLGASSVVCTNTTIVGAGPQSMQQLRLRVAVDPAATGTLRADFAVSGGGAGTATTVDPVTIGGPRGFGVDAFDGSSDADASGAPFTQAGGHPYSISTSIDFNTITSPVPLLGDRWPVEAVKDVFVGLPPGLVGSPAGVAKCDLIGPGERPREPARAAVCAVVTGRDGDYPLEARKRQRRLRAVAGVQHGGAAGCSRSVWLQHRRGDRGVGCRDSQWR